MQKSLLTAIALFVAGCQTPIVETERSAPPLRIASWNLEHLAEANGAGCRPRSDAEYAALRDMVDRLDALVIAFQEVESEAAAQRVFDPALYTIVIEARQGSASHPPCRGLEGQHLNRQAVGFAIRRGLEVVRHSDLSELQLGDPDLRSGVDIEVGYPGGPRLRLLGVHLKSGCAAGESSGACPILSRQATLLESWIDARARAGERFAVLGDFNRRFTTAGDRIWRDLDDGEPIDLALASSDAHATCDPRYTAFIDHIVISAPAFQSANFREWTYDGARLSDHCPISAEIRFSTIPR